MSPEDGAVERDPELRAGELAAAIVDELERRAELRYQEAQEAAAIRAAAPCSGCADDASRVSLPTFVVGGLIGLALYLLLTASTKESK